MKRLLNILNNRFRVSRPGSVLILVVALLVLMALIGTAFLSTQRNDRYTTVQHTNNTEIDLLLEGVKNMATATIVGNLNDPSLPFPYRPANSSIAKNWDMPDLFHQYTNDPLIGTTPNDAWLSPRCPTIHNLNYVTAPVDPAPQYNGTTPPESSFTSLPVWSCIGEPLTGNVFESPFVLAASGTGSPLSGIALTYTDRMTKDFVPPTSANPTPNGSLLTPVFATLSYPDGTTGTYPAFEINYQNSGTYYTYLAGDADGDGIADCGMWKLPVGQINGLTYYAGVRIVDNSSAINVNTALSRRYDFNGAGLPTRVIPASGGGTATYNGAYSLSCFESNVGLAELLESYDGNSTDNASGSLGSEFSAWTNYLLNNQTLNGVVNTLGVSVGQSPTVSGSPAHPIDDYGNTRTDFNYLTLGDLLTDQVGRRPSNPGYVGLGYYCQAATDSDAAALAYHFIFNNPNAGRTPLELQLHNSVYDDAPNGPTGPPNRAITVAAFGSSGYTAPSATSTSYSGNPSDAACVALAWYGENFDWSINTGNEAAAPGSASATELGDEESCMNLAYSQTGTAGANARCRRSIFTADSAVSNLTPRPVLTAFSTVSNGLGTISTGMTQITPTMCKASINTAVFGDLWRAFWLAMSADNGESPLGTNTSVATNTPLGTQNAGMYDHDLYTGQSIYTGSQFTSPAPANGGTLTSTSQNTTNFVPPANAPQHPQAMFRSTLRNPTGVFYDTSASGSGARTDSYIEADQMVLLRSAIAAANVEAMRDPSKGSSATIHTHDVYLNATVDGNYQQVVARVYGVTQQPYITEIYASTDTTSPVTVTHGDGTTSSGVTNTVPYVAVELFNPYGTQINLNGWQLAVVDRNSVSEATGGHGRNLYNQTTYGSSTPEPGYSVIHTFGPNDVVPSFQGPVPTTGTYQYVGGYALLENVKFTAGANGAPAATSTATDTPASYRPASADSTDNTATDGNMTRSTAYPTTAGNQNLNDIYVPELSRAIAKSGLTDVAQELVLLRPVNPAVTETFDQVPVDSYDFTGLTWNLTDPTKVPPAPLADVWHYVRGSSTVTGQSDSLWRFIYPGRYDATDPTPYASTTASPTPTGTAANPTTAPANPAGNRTAGLAYPPYTLWSRRQQGTQAARYYPTSTASPVPLDPFQIQQPAPPVTLGIVATTSSANPPSNDNPAASYPVTFPFQYLNYEQPSFSPLAITPTYSNLFPFGQFARNSDILQVPFVGSYVIFSTAPTATAGSPLTAPTDIQNIIELNPMPMDCSFAEDTDTTDDPPTTDVQQQPSANDNYYIWNESVGHFAPVNTTNYGSLDFPPANYRNLTGNASTQFIADSDSTLSYTDSNDPYAAYKTQYSSDSSTQRYWRYHWCSRIFDYLTVQNPNDDYFPNVQQQIYSQTPVTNPAGTVYGPQPLPVQNTASIAAANTTAVPAGGNAGNGTIAIAANPNSEDTVPVYGLININTAPWRVLAALRLCPFDDAETGADRYTIGGSGIPGASNTIPDNTELAWAIASWRDFGGSTVSSQVSASGSGSYPYTLYKGPFTSVADLLNVPAVQAYINALNNNKTLSTEPNGLQGHLSPFDFYFQTPAENSSGTLLTDGVRNDTDERFDLLHRLSNMVTTKSDVYTVYIVIQGWRNAGSTSSSNPPQMVTQRRAAFIVDRTGVTPTNSTVKIINVPTN